MSWRPSDLQYPPQHPLVGNAFKVQVCYIDSPKEFYVHVHDKDYWQYYTLRDNLNSFASPQLGYPQVGSACVVKHIDGTVRGRIVRRISSEIFKVEFVDFGFVDDFNSKEIRIIDKDFVKLPPFAVKCCLKEAEGILDVSDTLTKRFRDKVDRKQLFRMNFVRKRDDLYIVELEDGTCTGVEENLNSTDWTEVNSTFRTHFANRKRHWFNESDDESSNGMANSVVDVLESSESEITLYPQFRRVDIFYFFRHLGGTSRTSLGRTHSRQKRHQLVEPENAD